MSNIELFRILSKQWANVNDIKKIASCGRDNATYIRNQIVADIKEKGLNLPLCREKLVPMTYVIKYFNLDIDYISNMAKIEKNL